MMEASAIEAQLLVEDDVEDHGPTKGGSRTLPFILANESFEQVASFGLQPNMILYLTRDYHLDMATASNILFFWSAATNFMPVIGAVVADSFLGRYRTILYGSLFSLLGMATLWLTTIIPESRPPSCVDDSSYQCGSASTSQMLFLCASFGLMSVGAGGIRSSSLAFGADQLKTSSNRGNPWLLERYISLYYATSTLSIALALTIIVYVQERMGWTVGFGIPFLLLFISSLSFFSASSFYVNLKAKSSLVIELLQVAVASFRKRHTLLSSESADLLYHNKDGSSILPSEKLRFLNKACIISNLENDANGRAEDPWSLCTVEQVEDFKAVLKVLPIWSTGMLMSVNITQGSFCVVQAKSVNRKIGSSFEIPTGSFSLFMIASVVIWIVAYDRVLLPVASRIMRRPIRLSVKQRMGMGILMCFLYLVVSATVETARRNQAIEQGYEDDPEAVIDFSALWLIPQACLAGFSGALNGVAQNEFYYSEFPRSMSSIASSLTLLGTSVSNLVASLLLTVIDRVSKRGGNVSWISSNINKGHYDYYFWILAGLNVVNMVYFLICCRAYGPTKEDLEDKCRTHDPCRDVLG